MKIIALTILTFGIFALAWGVFGLPILTPIAGSEVLSLLVSGALYAVMLDLAVFVALLLFAHIGYVFFEEKNAVYFMFGMTLLTMYPLGVLLLHWLGSFGFFPQFTGWLLWVIPAIYILLSTSFGKGKEV